MSSTSSPVRVLIVDDHPLLRAGLRMLLESQPGITVVAETDSCASALEATAHKQPDIILLDLDLGEQNALDCLPDLLEAANQVRVIILTGIRDAELHQEAVRLGAVGLVLKEQATETLINAIECVQAGEVWLDRTLVTRILGRMNRTSQQRDSEADRIAALTEREREVITLIGEGLRNRQIAERLFISETTVRHHLTAIFDKLGVSDRLELVIYAYRHGLTRLAR
jgi:two-component system nitrate/nitrite response regulator NarL